MSVPNSLDELIVAHAAGQLPEPVGVAVATHLALHPVNRRFYTFCEDIGGYFLENEEPEEVSESCWQRLCERLDDDDRAKPMPQLHHRIKVPAPLKWYLPEDLSALHWHTFGALSEADIGIDDGEFVGMIYRLAAGRPAPHHGHGGQELTLILDGAYRDGNQRYKRGDLHIAGADNEHKPTAEPGRDCWCFAVRDAPIRLTGTLGRFVNPFLRR